MAPKNNNLLIGGKIQIRFDSQVDDGTNFQHKTILCMPIMYPNKPSKVLGVFQLVNKFDNLPFTKNDENFVEAFAIFCGMGIHNVHMYEKTVLAMAKQQVTLEVLRLVQINYLIFVLQKIYF